jgi:hypothetical protein
MKLKDKIKLVQTELTNEIKPLNTRSILDNAQIVPNLEQKKKPIFFNYRIRTAFSLILVLAVIITFAMLQNNPGFDHTDADSDSKLVYETIEEVYGFVATSAVALVYSSNDIFQTNNGLNTNSNLLVIKELSNLNRLLIPIEIMLSYDRNFVIVPSDKPQYRNKIIYQTTILEGEVLNYKIYFNETVTSSTQTRIDCLVVNGEDIIILYGGTNIIDNKTLLTMTYYIDNDNKKDYIQVSKNLDENADSYDYLIVKNNVEISKHKLTFNKDKVKYATLKNLLATDKSTTFNIYRSEDYNFKIIYEIVPLPTPEENEEQTDHEVLEESGNIDVKITASTSSYYVHANNSTNIINFDKSK